MMPSAEQRTFDNLKIKLTRSAAGTIMVWSGAGDLRYPEADLLTYLCELVDSLVGAPFTIDFRRTTFLNSSILSALLVFMRVLHEKGVRTTLQFHPQSDSQRSASRCLRSLSITLTSIAVIETS